MKWLLILVLIFISSCTLQNPVERGLEFLDESYSNCVYEDEYLKHVYPGEDLGYVGECRITYRTIDAFVNVKEVERDFEESYLIQNQVDDTNAVFDYILPGWRNEEISNTLTSSGNGVALDTYCIIAYLHEDGAMVDNAVSYLNEENNWIYDDYFGADTWRNIADETWCIRAMIVTGRNKELIDDLIDIKISEVDSYEGNSLFSAAVLYHIIYVLYEYEQQFGNEYAEVKDRYIYELVNLLDDEGVSGDVSMRANILEILSKVGYSDTNLLNSIYHGLLEEQESDGSWRIGAKVAPVFTTFRVLVGVNAYENTN